MTLDEAIQEFASQYGDEDKTIKDLPVNICSGGVRGKGKPFPALYAEESMAVEQWLWALEDYFVRQPPLLDRYPRFSSYRFWVAPKLETYQITMMDQKGTHRLTADRFVVQADVAFA